VKKTAKKDGASQNPSIHSRLRSVLPPPQRPLTRRLMHFIQLRQRIFGKVFNVACKTYLFIRRLIA